MAKSEERVVKIRLEFEPTKPADAVIDAIARRVVELAKEPGRPGLLRRWWSSLVGWPAEAVADIELRAAEIRAGISVIEAAAVDAFQGDLMTVTAPDDEQGRADLRDMTLELAKMGVGRAEDLEEMVRFWRYGQMFDIRPLELRAIGAILLERQVRQ